MPVDWSRYPANWKDVRERILDRADHCCERCGAPDRRVIVRDGHHALGHPGQLMRRALLAFRGQPLQSSGLRTPH